MAQEIKSQSTIGHVVGEGGICWCGVIHAFSWEFRRFYVCQHLANGKRCTIEIKKGDIFCGKHCGTRGMLEL